VLDLPPPTTPAAPVAEIASFASTSAWLDPKLGVVVRRGSGAQALTLSPKGLRDLDLGPAADGTPTLVYTRCAPSCDVYAYTLKPGAAEQRVAPAAKAGVSEHLPTLWKGTIAFERSGWVWTTRLGAPASAPAKKLLRGDGFEDLELGPSAIAFSGEVSSDEGNGATELDFALLRKPEKWYIFDRSVIGEGASAGFGGISADARGFFAWQRAFRNGCATPKRTARRSSPQTPTRTIANAAAPLSARYADPEIPATPMSEACEEE
jgi:hypothetical protein